MAYSSIPKPSVYFNTKLYTGNAATSRDVTGVGFKPDMTWIKSRTSTDTHAIFDIVRGVTKRIIPDNNTAEGTQSNGLKAFLADGFTLGDAGLVNQSYNYAAWNWLAGGGQGSSNTDGSINTTYTSANTTAGFSISQYTGTGSLATVGHGLGVAPSMIITKVLTTTHNWGVYHQGLGNTSAVYLDLTNDKSDDAAWWNNTSPTSTVFTINTRNEVNQGSQNYIAYCFAEKQGYSKFGSYVGNGNTDGPFNYCGFKPAFVMAKKTSATGGWQLRDNKRTPTGNLTNNLMYANATSVEQTTDGVDFLSNGWKLRNSAGDSNASGATYIYMAFAEEPLVANVGSSIPATAK